MSGIGGVVFVCMLVLFCTAASIAGVMVGRVVSRPDYFNDKEV